MKTKANLLNWISENSTIIDNEDDFIERLDFEIESGYLTSFYKKIRKLIDYYEESSDWEEVKEQLINLLFD